MFQLCAQNISKPFFPSSTKLASLIRKYSLRLLFWALFYLVVPILNTMRMCSADVFIFRLSFVQVVDQNV
jgi:hypothetical protein